MMEIHQILVSASAGDAVTNTALDFQRLLERVGSSRIFARYIDPRLDGKVRPLSAYETCESSDDLLIYHVSIGEPEVTQFLYARCQRIVIVYHNITPPEYFETLDPAFAHLLACGRAELKRLRDRVVLALAVSPYNARELEDLGYQNVRISPLPLNTGMLLSAEPDRATLAELDSLDGPLVLFVGQLLPHKRPDLLLQAYHVLTTYLLPDAHLVLLGPGRSERYHRALTTLASELNLSRCRIPGWLTTEQLAAHYQRATVFATMSEHEGVCVPLLEAMAFEVPTLARACAAIPDTVGGAALLLAPEDDFLLIAEALHLLVTDERLRQLLITRGRERVKALESQDAHQTFLSHLVELV